MTGTSSSAAWSGAAVSRRTVPYDLVRELVLALIGSAALIAILAAVLSSPDVPPLTIQAWAQHDPVDFVTTAVDELAGQSMSAAYGPPYTHGDGSVQSIGPFSPQTWAGVRIPVDPARDFVLAPLSDAAPGNPTVGSALAQYDAASASQQSAWLDAYSKALGSAQASDGHVVVAAGNYGPLPQMMDALLAIARTGGMDGLLLRSGRFYQTDFTRPLLFMGDGTYLAGLAQEAHLLGNQWGMMNETGSYPGQSWLWLYTLLYQIPPFNTSASADLGVVVTMGVLTLLLILVPYIPILRDIPRWIPVHRLIWRRWYREYARGAGSPRARSHGA